MNDKKTRGSYMRLERRERQNHVLLQRRLTMIKVDLENKISQFIEDKYEDEETLIIICDLIRRFRTEYKRLKKVEELIDEYIEGQLVSPDE